MLYQWEVGRLSMLEVRQTFWSAGHDSAATAPQAVRDLATRLADGVAAEIDRLDPMIVEAAEHWRLERMNVVDRLILRLATYEMLHETDYSPWEGHEVHAWPAMTILRGKVVVEAGRLLGEPTDGKYLLRKIPEEIRSGPML